MMKILSNFIDPKLLKGASEDVQDPWMVSQHRVDGMQGEIDSSTMIKIMKGYHLCFEIDPQYDRLPLIPLQYGQQGLVPISSNHPPPNLNHNPELLELLTVCIMTEDALERLTDLLGQHIHGSMNQC